MNMTSLAGQVTFFTTCKPFRGEAALLQRNALKSWHANGLDIVICGDEPGTHDMASALGARHITDIERSAKGIPLVSSIFAAARQCETPFLAYINADILLRPGLAGAIASALPALHAGNQSLLTFRRKNIPLGHTLPDEPAALFAELDALDEEYGSWDQSNAIDIFLFNRDLFDDIPPMVIGYMQWDNWLLWKARDRGAAVIDGSLDAALLHPIHGYSSDGTGLQARIQSADSVRNRSLVGGNSLDLGRAATHYLQNGSLKDRTPAADQLLADHCAPDLNREFWAGLKYLADGTSSKGSGRTEAEILDCCRTILWRHQRFFPFFERTGAGSHVAENIISEAFSLKAGNDFSAASNMIQDLIARRFLERCSEAAKARPLMVWGAGQAGQRVASLLMRHRIPVEAFVDRDKLKWGQNIHDMTVLDPEEVLAREDKPFLLIGSMHASEIRADLEQRGLTLGQDFSG